MIMEFEDYTTLNFKLFIEMEVKKGVLEGTLLSLTLFLTYSPFKTNNISGYLISYADDTVFFRKRMG